MIFKAIELRSERYIGSMEFAKCTGIVGSVTRGRCTGSIGFI